MNIYSHYLWKEGLDLNGAIICTLNLQLNLCWLPNANNFKLEWIRCKRITNKCECFYANFCLTNNLISSSFLTLGTKLMNNNSMLCARCQVFRILSLRSEVRSIRIIMGNILDMLQLWMLSARCNFDKLSRRRILGGQLV